MSSSFVTAFRRQAETARETGSPLYGDLLERAAGDLEAGGPLAALVEGWEGHPVLDNLPLRLLGAVHAEVLAGRAPELARFYPSAGGRFAADPAWRALRALVAERGAALRPRLDAPLQTNEVRRCCALVGGFLRAAAASGLPLRVLELGSSAGLLLLFDRYAYALGPHRVGPREAPLRLEAAWRGAAPEIAAPLRVVERAGCDAAPIDPSDPEARLRLEGFVWPDQPERLDRLRRALAVAAASPPLVAARRAAAWLPEVLAEPAPGRATVVFQSVVWWYLPEAEREAVTACMEDAGRCATARAPLFWLRKEGASAQATEIRLRVWPGGEDHLLGRSHWHGEWVAWGEAAARADAG